MNSIGTIIKEIIIMHIKGRIGLSPEFLVLENAQIQGLLLGTDYQRIYGIDIFKSKNRKITIGKNKEKRISLAIYQIYNQDPLKELLNKFKEGKYGSHLNIKQKLILLKMLRNNRPAFSIGKDPLIEIRGHDIKL
ncbi:hypothetical protein O181_011394 [Austropuccinia psidii MF-1]|uniref:Uncharacterized protein n=1 Tax=Austropuccinia psidii MF-1 TaxID=1389203 RepID=A0A9Q3BUD4_9BASI|nr:hypothetical protein [Austropuccinia psidii MF-1]